MRGPDGGSIHDPHANLPKPMWERKPTSTRHLCQRCKERKRERTKWVLKVRGGPQPGVYLICPVCDGTAGSVPEHIRAT